MQPILLRSWPVELAGTRLPIRLRPAFVLAAGLWAGLLAVLALAPIAPIPINDKLLHFFGNGLCAILVYGVIEPPPDDHAVNPLWSRSPLIVTLLANGLVMGVLSEFIQASFSARAFEAADIGANLAGLALALVVSARVWKNHQPLSTINRGPDAVALISVQQA